MAAGAGVTDTRRMPRPVALLLALGALAVAAPAAPGAARLSMARAEAVADRFVARLTADPVEGMVAAENAGCERESAIRIVCELAIEIEELGECTAPLTVFYASRSSTKVRTKLGELDCPEPEEEDEDYGEDEGLLGLD